MRIKSSFLALGAGFLAISFLPPRALAEEDNECLYSDAHFHIQDFKADGPRLADILKMMDHHVCRSTLMGLAVTVAYDPLIDGDFAPKYYTQSDGQVLY